MDLEKCPPHFRPMHCMCGASNKWKNSSHVYSPGETLMEHLFKEVCDKFTEPMRNTLCSWRSISQEPSEHFGLKGTQRSFQDDCLMQAGAPDEESSLLLSPSPVACTWLRLNPRKTSEPEWGSLHGAAAWSSGHTKARTAWGWEWGRKESLMTRAFYSFSPSAFICVLYWNKSVSSPEMSFQASCHHRMTSIPSCCHLGRKL